MATPNQLEIRRALAQRAGAYLREGYHCSESVVLAAGPHLVPDWHPTCARLSTGFAGGVGGSQNELCGAMAGGVMIIGALLGRVSLQDDALAQSLTKTFRRRFRESFGETECRWLRENVVLPQGGLGSCAVLVERTAVLLLDVLVEAGVPVHDG
jgi:C_GCAxxG_C_C family probable redox protein